MCGLIGAVGKGIVYQDTQVFFDGLRTLHLRGPHSTGIGYWDTRAPGCNWIKDARTPDAFLSSKETTSVINQIQDPAVLMGHVRYATKGEITAENAHPFSVGKTMMAHNGTINWFGKLLTRKEEDKFKVDSEALCYMIDKHGIDESLKSISGAYALTYIDEKKKTFNIIRNIQRDLFMVKNKNREVYYWSSERDHLNWILARNNISFDRDKISSVPIEQLFTYNIETGKVSLRKVDTHYVYSGGSMHNYYPYRDDRRDGLHGGLPNGYVNGNVNDHAGEYEEYNGTTIFDDDGVPWSKVTPKDDEIKDAIKEASGAPLLHPNVIPLIPRTATKIVKSGWAGTCEEFLSFYGVKKGDWIRVKLTKFFPYNPNNQLIGKAEGEFEDKESPDCLVDAHKFNLGLFNYRDHGKIVFKPGWYAARIKNCFFEGASEVYHVVLDEFATLDDKAEAKEPVLVYKESVPESKVNGGADGEKKELKLITKLITSEMSMSKKEFKDKTKDGCTLCHNNLHWHKKNAVQWVQKEYPVCIKCIDDCEQKKMDDTAIVTLVQKRVIAKAQTKAQQKAVPKLH